MFRLHYNAFRFKLSCLQKIHNKFLFQAVVLLEHIFEKNCSIEFINPVRPSVCTLFFRHISTYDLQILDSKRGLSIYEEYGFFDPKPRSSGIKLRLLPSQIKVFSLYFINFWQSMLLNWYHTIIVKNKYCRKSFSLKALEAAGSGSNLGFNESHLKKQDKESLTEVVT
jgi:hypothetical protein